MSASKTRSLEPRWRADSKELYYLEGNAGAQRFLMNVFASDVRPSLEVILNWAGTAK